MSQDNFESLTAKIREFAHARGWEKFHNPKNLAMAITGEAGELAAEFQWLTLEQSELENLSSEQLESIRLEMADVQIYLIRLADSLGLKLDQAVLDKLEINETRFKRPAFE